MRFGNGRRRGKEKDFRCNWSYVRPNVGQSQSDEYVVGFWSKDAGRRRAARKGEENWRKKDTLERHPQNNNIWGQERIKKWEEGQMVRSIVTV